MALDRNRLLKPVKKLRKLVKKIDRQPTPHQVHDLRTNTRRFEAMLAVLSLDSQGAGKSALKDLTRLRKRAGKVRDMDVLTSYASQLHPKGEEDCAVQLLEHLGAQRRKHAKKLYAEIQRDRSDVRGNLKRAVRTGKARPHKWWSSKGRHRSPQRHGGRRKTCRSAFRAAALRQR